MGKHARDLTPEELAKPYSKYFYNPPAAPDPVRLAAMNEPIDPAKALPLSRLNDLLNPGYLDCEAGWCQLPDGTGFIANLLPMPGVTVEMMDWWFAWFALEDLRYKLWYPPGHFAISMSDKDRANALNESLPMSKRRLRTEYVIENTNGPCDEKIGINFVEPEMFGFDMSRFHAPNVGMAACANGANKLLDPPPGIPKFKMPACLVHFVREVPGGVELRTRFWMGWHVMNKKPYKLMPDGASLPEIAIKGLATHNVCEFSNLASFLPQLYEEQKGKIA
jgi:phloretin hydrolase